MKDTAGELGVIYALIERFEKQRLPRLLELKKRVDKGEVFSESDIRFLQLQYSGSWTLLAIAEHFCEKS